MKTKTFELTIQESAVIAAECSLSLSDNRCDRPEGRAILERIIAKMAEPFGFEASQLRAICDAANAQKQLERIHLN
jgi:hypothetical protein